MTKEKCENFWCVKVERGTPGTREPDFTEGGSSWMMLSSRDHLQVWFCNCWQTENWNKLLLEGWREKNGNKKKNACSKMYADKNRKRKQKRKQRGKWCVSSSFSRLLASHYPSIVSRRGSQLAKKKRSLQTHILLITKPIIQKSGFEMGTIFNNWVRKFNIRKVKPKL